MKKSEMMVGLGIAPEDGGSDGDGTDPEGPEDTKDDSEEDDAIDAFLDPKTDPETRREMFRKAVELCTKSYGG